MGANTGRVCCRLLAVLLLSPATLDVEGKKFSAKEPIVHASISRYSPCSLSSTIICFCFFVPPRSSTILRCAIYLRIGTWSLQCSPAQWQSRWEVAITLILLLFEREANLRMYFLAVPFAVGPLHCLCIWVLLLYDKQTNGRAHAGAFPCILSSALGARDSHHISLALPHLSLCLQNTVCWGSVNARNV